MIKKGSWVSIQKTLLEPQQRTASIPDDTAATPFVLWVKGRLQNDAGIGDEVSVTTRTGRTESGILESVNPNYELNYGSFVPELLDIGEQARTLLKGGEDQ